MKKASLIGVIVILCSFFVLAIPNDDLSVFYSCPDFDKSGKVGFDDYFMFADHFGTNEQGKGWDYRYDLDDDGDVDADDLVLFNFDKNFGKICSVETDEDFDCIGVGDGVQVGSCNSEMYCYNSFCCGNDATESFIDGEDGSSACCFGADYFVENGNCSRKIHDVGVRSVNAPSSADAGQNVKVEAEVFNNGDYDEEVNVKFYVDNVVKETKSIRLEEGMGKGVSFFWGAVEGIHELLVRVFVSGDSDDSDNENSVEINVKVDSDLDCFGIGNGIQVGSCNSEMYCYAGSCCGDDVNEYFVYQEAGTSPYINDNPSKGKCYIQSKEPNICLFGDDGKRPFDAVTGKVYLDGYVGSADNRQYEYKKGEVAGSISGSTWRGAVCNNGAWDELCDVSKYACNAGCGVRQTESSWMESKNYCCGDDVNEYPTEGEDGSSACCFGADYFVENGNCYQKVHDVGVRSVNAPSSADAGQNVKVEAEVFNNGDYDEEVNVKFYVDSVDEGGKIVYIEKGGDEEISFFWRAIGGIHDLLIRVFVNDDSNNLNNENSAEIEVDEGICHLEDLGNLNYCSIDCKCRAGEGDCDSDSECEEGLRCVTNVGKAYGFSNTTDVCELKEEKVGLACGDAHGQIFKNEGDLIGTSLCKNGNSSSFYYSLSNKRWYWNCEASGGDYVYCGAYKSVEPAGPECSSGGTKCEGMNYFTCANNKWVSQGEVSGYCGVEILDVCEDSDGGLNYEVKGRAGGKETKWGKTYSVDACKDQKGAGVSIIGKETKYLAEAICENNNPKFVYYECPNGCFNGACT
ncbi:MAG: hypothetical protein KKC19_00925 [Nanoarchaeota archaeon]|nr:hypothetical protein [Nanoarchaeota archaeon]